MTPAGRIVRLAERERPEVRFRLDGAEVAALAGDTVLTAVLAVAPPCAAPNSGPRRGPASV